MNKTRTSGTQIFSHPIFQICLLCLVVVCSRLLASAAEDVDEQYLRIHNLVQQGESLVTMGDTNKAMTKFKQAQSALATFARQHPEYNPKMVAYRLNYLNQKVSPPAPKGKTGAATAIAAPRAEAESGAAPAADKSVKLLEPGAEPRQALRLRLKAGDQSKATMTMTMAMDMQMGQVPVFNVKLPPLTMVFDTRVTEVRPNGDAKYEMIVAEASMAEGADTPAAVGDALKKSFTAMKGVTGTGIVTAQGISKDVQMKAPAGADPQTKQALDQVRDSFSRMACPLPAEPIGAGAKWEIKTPVKSQGMTLQQTASYELVSVEGDRATLKTILAQSAANQKIANPSMPNVPLDVKELKAEGKGESVVDLGRIAPIESVLDFHSNSEMSMNAGGQAQAVSLKVDVNAKMEAK